MLKDQRGQVFLIILLVMVIALTVGLSIASRSIVSLRTSREERDSQRALSAAEAGIERYLRTSISIPLGPFPGDTSITYSAIGTQVEGSEILVHGDNVIPKDEGADIWLIPHNASNDLDLSSPWSGFLTIYWGSTSDVCDSNPADNTMAALEVAVVSGPVIAPVLTRSTYDPCAARRGNNNFLPDSGGGTVDGKPFSYSTPSISITSGFVIKVVPLYASSLVGSRVDSGSGFPSQGIVIDATGQSSGTSRKVKVFQGYPSLPSQFFLYGLFSP